MEKEEIIRKIKFAEECAANVQDPTLKGIAFKEVLTLELQAQVNTSLLQKSNTLQLDKNIDEKKIGSQDLWLSLATFFEIPVEHLKPAISIDDKDGVLLKLTDFGEGAVALKECKVAIILLALNELITGKSSMSALEMASKLNKLGIDSGGNTKRNIEVNAQKKDIKGVYIAGKGRGVTYTINITGKNLAKEWLREILHIQ